VCSNLFFSLLKRDCQGRQPLTWGLGPRPNFLFPLRAACGGAQKERKRFFGDTPNHGKGLAALCNPACGDF